MKRHPLPQNITQILSALGAKGSRNIPTNWLRFKFAVSTGLLLGEYLVLCAPHFLCRAELDIAF